MKTRPTSPIKLLLPGEGPVNMACGESSFSVAPPAEHQSLQPSTQTKSDRSEGQFHRRDTAIQRWSVVVASEMLGLDLLFCFFQILDFLFFHFNYFSSSSVGE